MLSKSITFSAGTYIYSNYTWQCRRWVVQLPDNSWSSMVVEIGWRISWQVNQCEPLHSKIVQLDLLGEAEVNYLHSSSIYSLHSSWFLSSIRRWSMLVSLLAYSLNTWLSLVLSGPRAGPMSPYRVTISPFEQNTAILRIIKRWLLQFQLQILSWCLNGTIEAYYWWYTCSVHIIV